MFPYAIKALRIVSSLTLRSKFFTYTLTLLFSLRFCLYLSLMSFGTARDAESFFECNIFRFSWSRALTAASCDTKLQKPYASEFLLRALNTATDLTDPGPLIFSHKSQSSSSPTDKSMLLMYTLVKQLSLVFVFVFVSMIIFDSSVFVCVCVCVCVCEVN